MSRFNLTALGGNRWSMAGDLTLETVPNAWRRLASLVTASSQLTISLSRINSVNSAALVMLLQALDLAEENRCELRFVDIPGPLLALASLSNVEQLLAGQP